MNIKNKIAVITGGASGLGEATTRKYHSLGGKVAIFDMNKEKGKALEQELGENVKFYPVNVTDVESVSTAIRKVKEAWKTIHICNNFAGILSPIKTIGRNGPGDLSVFQNVINVNLIGTFNVCRLVAWEMSQQESINDDNCKGVIINTASVAAYEGQIGQVAYAASKGAIASMTIVMARDLARNGIRVNTLVPGIIHTPIFDQVGPEILESLEQQPTFPKRLGRPEEVAKLCQYLVENDYMNGECIRMDAGIRMQAR